MHNVCKIKEDLSNLPFLTNGYLYFCLLSLKSLYQMQSRIDYPGYVKFTILIVGTIAFFSGLYLASDVLIPLAAAGLIALLLHPISERLEGWGIHRILAIFICLILMFVLLAGIILLLSSQIISLANDLPDLTEQIMKKIDRMQAQTYSLTNISPDAQVDWLKERASEFLASGGAFIRGTVTATTSTFSILALIPIYIFFLLYYRDKLRVFVLKLAPQKEHEQSNLIMGKVKDVMRNYVSGLMIVILILSVLNTVGLTVLGIPFALFFGVLAALLTVIPYIGVLIGSLLPALMAFITKDSLWYPVGVVALFSFIQFLEGNFITPKIVGSRVSINPLAAILALIVGGAIWGIPGMILFVPFLGMLKVILDNIESLKPFGFLLGTEGNEEHSVSLKKILESVNPYRSGKRPAGG